MFEKIIAAQRARGERARARTELRHLLTLDDHLLRDVGFTRDELAARLVRDGA